MHIFMCSFIFDITITGKQPKILSSYGPSDTSMRTNAGSLSGLTEGGGANKRRPRMVAVLASAFLFLALLSVMLWLFWSNSPPSLLMSDSPSLVDSPPLASSPSSALDPIESDALNLNLSYDLKSLNFSAASKRYGLFIDAGSSGSRVYVYSWPAHSSAKNDLSISNPLELPKIEKGAKEGSKWQLKVKPG
ncbi:Golgi apyrase [Nowakowskiella sp. JEL0078]|nr:Golgi apyrase [Nowakowskiella sp. JEL0078]